jgi:hypothetical protein
MYTITDELQMNPAKAYQNNPDHSHIDFRRELPRLPAS